MSHKQPNPGFTLLSSAATYLRRDFLKAGSAWSGSPFEWVLKLPSGSKGKLGKRLVYQWCALQGLAVGPSPDSQADMMVNGHRVEIKFSTLWRGGIYKFQQIRDQNYEYCICLGISPFEAHCWVISKAILKARVIGHLGQHTGAGGKDTAWIAVDPGKQQKWLDSCGGTLEEAYATLKALGRKK